MKEKSKNMSVLQYCTVLMIQCAVLYSLLVNPSQDPDPAEIRFDTRHTDHSDNRRCDPKQGLILQGDCTEYSKCLIRPLSRLG